MLYPLVIQIWYNHGKISVSFRNFNIFEARIVFFLVGLLKIHSYTEQLYVPSGYLT